MAMFCLHLNFKVQCVNFGLIYEFTLAKALRFAYKFTDQIDLVCLIYIKDNGLVPC